MRLNVHVKPEFIAVALALLCLPSAFTHAQPARSITLDPPTGLDLQAHTMDAKGNLLPEAPPNFRRLGHAIAG